jgi:hypothetical protein
MLYGIGTTVSFVKLVNQSGVKVLDSIIMKYRQIL